MPPPKPRDMGGDGLGVNHQVACSFFFEYCVFLSINFDLKSSGVSE